MQTLFRRLRAAWAILPILVAGTPDVAGAAELCRDTVVRETVDLGSDWTLRPVRMAILEQSLAGTIQDLGTLAGTAVQVGPGVRGVVRRTRLDGPLRDVLASLTAQHGLMWFGDGRQLAVVAQDEAVQRFLTVPGVREASLCAALMRFKVAGTGLELVVDERSNVVYASGPPAFVNLVEMLSGTQDRRSPVSEEFTVIKFGVKTSQ